jgi:hypothetical protein
MVAHNVPRWAERRARSSYRAPVPFVRPVSSTASSRTCRALFLIESSHRLDCRKSERSFSAISTAVFTTVVPIAAIRRQGSNHFANCSRLSGDAALLIRMRPPSRKPCRRRYGSGPLPKGLETDPSPGGRGRNLVPAPVENCPDTLTLKSVVAVVHSH